MKNIFNFPQHYKNVKAFHSKYERFLMPTFLVAGFVFDYIVFANIEISLNFIFLMVYWIVAGVAIVVTTLYDSGKIKFGAKYIRLVAFLVIQFSFGGLLRGSLLFYWFSGALSISWPLIVVIALLMLFYDVFREFFLKPVVQLSLYFFITFSFFVLALPFFFNSISVWLFVVAGALSLAVFFPYILLLFYFGHAGREKQRRIFTSIIIIFFIINTLYFFNIIPPIPLSIREAEAFHSLKVSGGKYIMQGELETFWQNLIPGQTLHLQTGERVYLYTAIFAPATLNTTIVNRWQYFNETTKKWLTMSNASFDIAGGRQQGYKGYSWFLNPAPGRWRVFVQTPRGQVLGKVNLNIVHASTLVEMGEFVR